MTSYWFWLYRAMGPVSFSKLTRSLNIAALAYDGCHVLYWICWKGNIKIWRYIGLSVCPGSPTGSCIAQFLTMSRLWKNPSVITVVIDSICCIIHLDLRFAGFPNKQRLQSPIEWPSYVLWTSLIFHQFSCIGICKSSFRGLNGCNARTDYDARSQY